MAIKKAEENIFETQKEIEQGLTQNDFIQRLKKAWGMDEESVEEESRDWRYVIYARKSRDEPDKQIRSIPDQIIECKEFAKAKELKLIKPESISEAESAKEPDIRPEFRRMLEEIKSGKYEGIVCWHPDRLARNMKEAGEIIDCIDKSIIKDLKFASFSFDNNTAGKMLLGIAFVLSKEYSDRLSDNVTRGIRRSVAEGKYINRGKRGYYKDPNQLLRPNGNNFLLIKEAFRMRAEDNKTLEEIAGYLNGNDYSERSKSGRQKKVKMDEKKVSEFLRDPTYMGVLIYGDNIVNLMEKYDFRPAVSVDNFTKINKEFSSLKKGFRLAGSMYKRGESKTDLMRRMVICGECGNPMGGGITKKYAKKREEAIADGNEKGEFSLKKVLNKQYFFYRCNTPNCKRRGKSVRAKVILKFVNQYFACCTFDLGKMYKKYVADVKEGAKIKEKECVDAIKAGYLRKTRLEKNLGEIKELMLGQNNKTIIQEFTRDLENLRKDIKNTQNDIEKLKEIKKKNKTAVMDSKKFFELIRKIAVIFTKIKSMQDLDKIVRLVFLNFTFKGGKLVSYRVNPAFEGYIKHDFFSKSRSGEI